MSVIVSEPYHRFEGEVVRSGINYCDSLHFDYVIIRRGGNLLEIAIPKENPKNYSIEEFLMNKWDQKLWL